MKKLLLPTLMLLLGINNIVAQQLTQGSKWLPMHEAEYLVRGAHEEIELDTYYGYDERLRIIKKHTKTWDAQDSLVYAYNEDDQLIYEADYRANQLVPMFLYTYDQRVYDPLITDLCTWHVGWQNVDQEWTVYIAEKLGIERDVEDQIVRIGDYTPGDANTPDIPVSYVKTFGYANGHLDNYKREGYNMDPVTEEPYLHLEQQWTNIQWEDYEGQVIDPDNCFHGANRIKSAHVFDDYYGYEYDLTVKYDVDKQGDFEAIMDIASFGQKKIHTLKFTDDNGSFIEEFRTYNVKEGAEDELRFVERITENYDEYGNLTLTERALTDDNQNPSHVSTRQGKKYNYSYDETYNDWVSRDTFNFYQSYEPGEDGYYERVTRNVRNMWEEFATESVTEAPKADSTPHSLSQSFDLSGRAFNARRGILIQNGRKVIR